MSQEDRKRYEAAAHAMQSGVAMKMNYRPDETKPKHLRAGVNSAMVNSAALATLLIGKGLFTLDEYEKALVDAMEREQELYTKEVSRLVGKPVTLA